MHPASPPYQGDASLSTLDGQDGALTRSRTEHLPLTKRALRCQSFEGKVRTLPVPGHTTLTTLARRPLPQVSRPRSWRLAESAGIEPAAPVAHRAVLTAEAAYAPDSKVEQLRGVAPLWSALATRCLTGRPQLHEMVGTTGFAPAASASPRQRSSPELRPEISHKIEE